MPADEARGDRDRQEAAAWAARFTLMDDAYMAKFFDGQPRCAEAVLRPILGIPDLEVETAETHRDLANLQGRAAVLDVFATDGEGRVYDIEVQRDAARATPRRARFYASLMDADTLPKGADFDLLPESYVIFICDGDALGGGRPLYRVARTVEGTGRAFGDGSHIVYADASYNRDDGGMSPGLADVLHDFLCADPAAMRCAPLARRARYLKQTEKGASEMATATDEIMKIGMRQGMEQGVGQSVARLVRDGTLTREQIAAIFGITPEDVDRCAREYAV